MHAYHMISPSVILRNPPLPSLILMPAPTNTNNIYTKCFDQRLQYLPIPTVLQRAANKRSSVWSFESQWTSSRIWLLRNRMLLVSAGRSTTINTRMNSKRSSILRLPSSRMTHSERKFQSKRSTLWRWSTFIFWGSIDLRVITRLCWDSTLPLRSVCGPSSTVIFLITQKSGTSSGWSDPCPSTPSTNP